MKMSQQTKDDLWGLVKLACVIVFVIAVIAGIWIKIDKTLDDWGKKEQAKHEIRKVYRARLPKAGDRVILNDINVSIVKEYVWSAKFRVRYDDGRMADVAEKEMLDLKKVKPKIPEKQKNV
jgi:hypothetical protein